MTRRARHIGKQIGLGLLGIALVTAACFPFHLGVSIPSMLYLLMLVFLSLSGDFVPVAAVSIFAAAVLEYVFIPPVLQWQINNPEDGVVLATYLVTCLVVTRLATRARQQALAAEQKGRDVSLLYDTASRLLSLGPEGGSDQWLRVFREVFDLDAASFFEADTWRSSIEGQTRCGLVTRTWAACTKGESFHDPAAGVYIRCLRRGSSVTGAVGIEGFRGDETLIEPLSVLAATALDRMQTFRKASKAAADTEAEILRSAILDAFAHEFKTPLAIILAAAGSLYEIAGGCPEQMELTEFIENQTLRLNQLTTRLLRMAKLDRDEVRPMLERVSLDGLLDRVAGLCQSQFGRLIPIIRANRPIEIMADPELLSLAITQLLDNACKYSTPGTPVAIAMDAEGGRVEVRVTNQGNSIRPEEQERIFERFVRGAGQEQFAPGSGLGLYVARKIARAHGGDLQLDRARSTVRATTFQIELPVCEEPAFFTEHAAENSHEQETPQSAGC